MWSRFPECALTREPVAIGGHKSRRWLVLALAAIAALGVTALAAIGALNRDTKTQGTAQSGGEQVSRAEEPTATTVLGAPPVASDDSLGQRVSVLARPSAISASPP